ncbi:hisitidine kinase [Pontibacillus halophilus JSM 076056 = DSM 19796]|uniref:Hisitidine kinase n=1 Tax=Pontibacillus halophilus JSM 076056 = DSM 19796 TaxID=1385510 RepID=A0A0A5GEU7_9BACI|nr:HD-GYP domain-containing protein [Pontibacillus halophilus]KGX89645.1 hisitidine kinase [Pontibacillus halophilus JSM 076056 = DSM 19796]
MKVLEYDKVGDWMRLISTSSLTTDDYLAKAIYNDRGRILVQAGTPLTKRMIARLSELNVTYVYIEDEHTSDIEVTSSISDERRQEAMNQIETTFQMMKESPDYIKSFITNRTAESMGSTVRSIIEDIQKHNEVVTLLSDVFSYDNYIFSHSVNVTVYSLALGMEMGLNRNQLEQIGFGAMLHDVGKMFTPKEILFKPSRLTDEEYGIIKQHTTTGFNMLRKAPNIPLVSAHCAYQHHERLNGTGYPRGIEADDIHLYAKIIGIADVFDAVTSNRVYRRAMLPHEGMEVLYAGADTLFDYEMIQHFRRSIALYPNGLTVHLSDGKSGVVFQQNNQVSDRPIVRVLEHHQQRLRQPYLFDLSKHLNVIVKECETTLVQQTS